MGRLRHGALAFTLSVSVHQVPTLVPSLLVAAEEDKDKAWGPLAGARWDQSSVVAQHCRQLGGPGVYRCGEYAGSGAQAAFGFIFTATGCAGGTVGQRLRHKNSKDPGRGQAGSGLPSP